MKFFVTIITTLFLVSCGQTLTENTPFKVEYAGSLKGMMHENDIAAHIDLKEFKESSHVYGLGAMENLKGEILILNGIPFIASVNEQQLMISNSFDHKATLFVYTTVENWLSIPVPGTIKTYAELEVFTQEKASENNIDTNEPFPFLLEGVTESLDWHVIDWKDGDTVHSHEKHVNSGLNGTLINPAVKILGFYSNSHHGIFTHHSTNMHLHVQTSNNIVGHVDDLRLGTNMTLKLPDSD